MPNPYLGKCRRGKVRGVHAYRLVPLSAAIRIMRDASALLAAVIVPNLLVPGVFGKTALRGFNRN